MRILFLSTLMVLVQIGTAHTQVPPTERAALILFFDQTNGDSWTTTTNWKLPPLHTDGFAMPGTECTWFGVVCNGGHVWGLVLNSNQLTGSLPPELGDLPEIVGLTLYQNQLTGSIPPELGNLPNLLGITLYGNQLSGSIPPELGNLSTLTVLSLYNNLLTGSIPPELGNLSNLGTLHLRFNELTGSIPSELGDLSSLEYLHLGSNQLTGGIPPELGGLSILQELRLDRNPLGGSIPPELGNLANLTALELDFAGLTGPMPPQLGDVSSLETLTVTSNQLDGSIPPELGDLSSLTVLGLSNNQFEGSIPPEIGNLSNLTSLFLSANRLSGAIPAELGLLSNLIRLDLFSNRLNGEIPAEIEDLSMLGNDGGLRIRWNALHTDNASLIAFLNAKQWMGNWQSTQTIAPENLSFARVGDHTIWLNWDAVAYQSDPGGTSVFFAPTGTGNWTAAGWTESKTTTTHPVTGLDPGTIYDLAVASYTDPHVMNLNLVNSDFGSEVVAQTGSTGCAEPAIEITGLGPFNLSVTGSFDSYLWNTGATTSSIVVDPPTEQWYWVTVTSAGPCEETAATPVDPGMSLIFADGFESGGTSAWS